jgi:hypothetical protein
VTVLVSVLGETVTVLGGTVVVPMSVLGGGAVSVTVWVGAPPPPPPRGDYGVVVTVVVMVAAGVVVVGPGAGEPVTNLNTAISCVLGRLGALIGVLGVGRHATRCQ